MTVVEAIKLIRNEPGEIDEYPSMEEVEDAIKQDNVLQMIRWHLNLRSPVTKAEVHILNAIIDHVTILKRRKAA